MRDGSTVWVLVVDDGPDVQNLFVRSRTGPYMFDFARPGAEALRALDRRPDIVVLLSDISMSLGDGLSLLSSISDGCLGSRGMVISAYGGGERSRTSGSRAAGFVVKPLDFLWLRTLMAV